MVPIGKATPMVTITVTSPVHGERTWQRTGTRPYVNRKGESAPLAAWQTPCVVCGAPFEITIPAKYNSPDKSNAFQMTTCPDHRMTPSETAKLRFTPSDKRRAAFETIKTAKLEQTFLEPQS